MFMKATLIAYASKGLSKTESSKLSKALIGYMDKSNNGKYSYSRKGLVNNTKNIIICRSAFIVPRDRAKSIISFIKKRRAKALSWNLEISQEHFKI